MKKTEKEKNAKSAIITDSMSNIITGLGIEGISKNIQTKFKYPAIKSWKEWQQIYAGNGMVRRIIDTIANEMTREWITLDGDDEDKSIMSYLDSLDCKSRFADLTRWANLLGGAIIIMIIDDGRELDEPVDINNIRAVEQLRVIDLSQIYLDPIDFYSDPRLTNFNEPEKYTIRPIFRGVSSGETIFKVHESRVLAMDGAPVTQYLRYLNKGWAAPMLQSCYWDIVNLEQAYTYASEAIHELVVGVYSLSDLGMRLASEGGEERLKQRLSTINYNKSVLNSIVLNSQDEKYEKISAPISQIDTLLAAFESKVSSMVGIPYGVLFGEKHSGGIVNAESGDIRIWYDNIKNKQEQNYTPLLRKLIRYISLADNCAFSGYSDDIKPVYSSLWQYDEKDLVAMQLQTAQIDASNIDRGIYTAAEARERYVGQRFDFDLRLQELTQDEIDERNKWQEPDWLQQDNNNSDNINNDNNGNDNITK